MGESSSGDGQRILDQQREEGQAMVASWRASGLSMRAYALRAGISERRLGLWRRRLERSAGNAPAENDDASVFVPVTVQDRVGLDVIIDDRIRIRVDPGSDLDLLRRTVAALRC